MTCFVDRKSIGFILHHRQQQQQQHTRRDESKLIYFNVLTAVSPLFFLFPVRTFLYMYNKKVYYTTGKRLFDLFFFLTFGQL
jgi:hypothetical protein